MQFAVLSGDPKTAAYTQIRKVPAGTDNPLHSHSSEITNVIISGIWYTGPNSASAKDFGPGSVITMPADWVHVSGCRSGSECVFYQQGKGKFDFKPLQRLLLANSSRLLHLTERCSEPPATLRSTL
jgi:hypothetical protein